MRLWDWRLLPYLPDLQFKGQLREIVLIMRDWRDRGTTNHLLINKVMEYPKSHLYAYWRVYRNEYKRRYGKELLKYDKEFADFADNEIYERYIFPCWHSVDYLQICMTNLYEKHKFGVGKSRITDDEWETLRLGYLTIQGTQECLCGGDMLKCDFYKQEKTSNCPEKVIIGQKYRNYKGKTYKTINIAKHTETGEQLVIYEALYGEHEIYARPIKMWSEKVFTPRGTVEPRFMSIEE